MTAVKKNAPEVIGPFSEKEALAKVRVIEQNVDMVVRTIGELPMQIEDDEDFKVASTELIKVVMQREVVEENLALFMADVQKMIDRVNGWFAKSRADVARAELYFRDALRAYAKRLNDQAHQLRLDAGKLPAKQSDEADAMLVEANGLKAPKVPGISLTAKAKIEILDEKKIPEKYWKRVVDKAALEAAADEGLKVPGVKFDTDYTVRVTPKHAKLGDA